MAYNNIMHDRQTRLNASMNIIVPSIRTAAMCKSFMDRDAVAWNALPGDVKGMCPKIPLCVICVHSYTNIILILYSYTTPSKFGEKSRHLCILDEGIIRHLPRKCFTYGDATLGC